MLTNVLYRLFGREARARRLHARALRRHGRGDTAGATRDWRTAAAAGCAEAQFRLGGSFDRGDGVLANALDAVRWYRAAAEQGHADAQARLAELCFHGSAQTPGTAPTAAVLNTLYPNGVGLDRDVGEAVRWARVAAERGVASAQALLGCILSNGVDRAPDYGEARHWYERAAEQGHAGGQLGLGTLLAGGYLGPPDPAGAAVWFARAGAGGEKAAFYFLGLIHARGLGGPQDFAKAADCFREAAEAGMAAAQRALGTLTLHGQGIPADRTNGESWLRRAALQGDADAMVALGDLHGSDTGGVPSNPGEAAGWYRMAAELGHGEAQRILAGLHRIGRGVSRDMDTAVRWLERAAENGDVPAQVELGTLHAGGAFAGADPARAIDCFSRAAEAGSADALCNLGLVHAMGIGVPRDPVVAVSWYERAAAAGSADAAFRLGALYAAGDGVPRDDRAAVNWTVRAAEAGHAGARTNLGRFYMHGLGVPADPTAARRWLELAAGQRESAAMEALKELDEPMIDWRPGEPVEQSCPICSAGGAKPHRLTIRHTTGQGRLYRLHDCPVCGSAFFDPPPDGDYEQGTDAESYIKFYVEQGGGPDVMLEPTAILDLLPIRRCLEIGCGYGFSLDYGARERGWTVRGYDPGLFARAGREALGLDIRHAYVGAQGMPEETAAWDAVVASEVIEHLADPGAFLAEARGMLSAGGVLVLTTPNAAAIDPATEAGTLLPLLSVGYHIVLFSAGALKDALERAGFAHVRVEEEHHRLRAIASDRPLPATRPLDRAAYERYLEGRTALHVAGTPLGDGFRHRLLKERVNAGRYREAEAILEALRQGWMSAYGFDLAVPEGIVLPQPGEATFTDLAERFPFNLCGVLHAQGIVQRNARGDAVGAARSFGAAAAFAARLRTVLQGMGTDDGETADLAANAQCERVTALAVTDAGEALRAWHDLRQVGSGASASVISAERTERTRGRLIVTLVNTGAYEAAATLVAEGDDIPDGDGGENYGERLSLAFAIGMLRLNHSADPVGAAAAFGRLWAACRIDPAAAPVLFWPSRHHEGLALERAGRMDEAREAARDLMTASPAAGGGQLPEIPAAGREWAERLLGA